MQVGCLLHLGYAGNSTPTQSECMEDCKRDKCGCYQGTPPEQGHAPSFIEGLATVLCLPQMPSASSFKNSFTFSIQVRSLLKQQGGLTACFLVTLGFFELALKKAKVQKTFMKRFHWSPQIGFCLVGRLVSFVHLGRMEKKNIQSSQ